MDHLFYSELPAGHELLKAEALGPGERWVTVTPPGHDKGRPLLIRENPDGSATVIGGLGGALTGLRLRSRKAGETDTEAIKRKQEERRKARADRIAQEKADGSYADKQEARKQIAEQKLAAEKDFIASVAKARGWDPATLEPPAESLDGLDEAEQEKVRRSYHRQMLSAAHKEAGMSLARAKLDHVARAKEIGEIPVDSGDPEVMSVADLDPVKPASNGMGFSPDYKKRAEEAGATPEAVAAELAEMKAEKLALMTPDEKASALKKDAAGVLKAESEAIRSTPLFDPKAQAKQADMKADLDVLTAQKKLKLLQQKAREANKEVDSSTVVPKAFSLVADDDASVAEAVQKEIVDDLRTVAARNFLKTVDDAGREQLQGHIAAGAFNSINALSLTVAGEGLVDRSVVDVLGVDGATRVLASRLRLALEPDEFKRTVEALEEHHSAEYAKSVEKAVEQATEWHNIAKSIELPKTAVTGSDFALAKQLNEKKREAVFKAKQILGTVLGETEANASLIAALRGFDESPLSVPLGKLNEAAAVVQARALGLKKGDYEIEKVGSQLVMTVHPQGVDRLARPMSREDLTQLKRSQAIIRGDKDEDGWLPLGFASRPDLATKAKPGVAPKLAIAFEPGEDLAQSLKDYVGSRMADGDAPADILADIQSASFIQKSGGDAVAYGKALSAVAPLKDESGKVRRAEDFAPIFDGYADEFVAKLGGDRTTLNKQAIPTDAVSVEAMHRALSKHPEGLVAFKPVGELTAKDQSVLRDWFAKNVAKESPEEAKLRSDLEQLQAAEPEKTVADMFGDVAVNPEWQGWKSERDALSEKINSASLSWQKYVKTMRGTAGAYEALQDMIRSNVSKAFADAHNTLRPDAALKVGRTTIRNNLNHLDAVDPQARVERAAKEAALRDALRERVDGKYASGSVTEKLQAAKEQSKAFEQAQMGFFSSDEVPAAADGDVPLGKDERFTLGHAAEGHMAKLMSVVGPNFKPGEPVKLWNPSMSGKYAPQQRAIKLLEANKRLGGSLGAGSGKTAIMLGGFSHLHAKGKVKRALMIVPSIVQGQFAGEALRYLEPGKYKWHIEPGASREERIAAYKDPENHFAVMTHQSFRDDMIHLGAKHAGVDEGAMTQQVNAMSPDQRQAWMRSIMDKEGINFDATFVDEAHETVNRAGKENSTLANVADALSDNTPYYGYFSGDPIKNDASELHSVLSKLDRKRYGDRGAFMRKYGVNTMGAKDALRREMSRYVFPNRISSGVNADRKVEQVELSEGQKKAMDELDGHFASASLARAKGEVALDAMKAISPGSFEGRPESDHGAIAAKLQKSLGIMRSSAVKRIINSHPDNAKVNRLVEMVKERKGKQGVVFAKNRDSIEAIKSRLEAEGLRVVTITGSDSAKEKDRKRKLFNPESGEAQADIMLASDAGAVGMNLQSGRYLIQHDVPDTAKTHGQRNARIDRLGQKNDVELIDLVANHPEEFKSRDRLARKYDLRELMTSPMDGLDDTGLAWRIKQKQMEAAA